MYLSLFLLSAPPAKDAARCLRAALAACALGLRSGAGGRRSRPGGVTRPREWTCGEPCEGKAGGRAATRGMATRGAATWGAVTRGAVTRGRGADGSAGTPERPRPRARGRGRRGRAAAVRRRQRGASGLSFLPRGQAVRRISVSRCRRPAASRRSALLHIRAAVGDPPLRRPWQAPNVVQSPPCGAVRHDPAGGATIRAGPARSARVLAISPNAIPRLHNASRNSCS